MILIRRLVCALLVTAAISLEGCGGGGGGASPTNASASSSAPTSGATPSGGTAAPGFSLAVHVTGAGKITSSPAGIACTGVGQCTANFPAGSTVQLTETPASGQAFAGWSDACGGNGVACEVVMNAAQSAGATFHTTPVATGNEQILFTDVASGPTTGGENNDGAYLSIFGRNFGTDPSAIRVLIGGIPVARIMSVGLARVAGGASPALPLEQITVQVGALGNPTLNGTPLPIVVQRISDGTLSNSDITFTPNKGRMLYVSLNGSDTTAVAGDISRPWRHVQSSSMHPSVKAAYDNALPGDFIVMLGGVWQDKGYDGYFMRARYQTGSAPKGTSGGPITLMGYPGQDVFLDMTYAVSEEGGLTGTDNTQFPGAGNWFTVSNLRIEGGGNAGPIALQIQEDHWRIVNNEMTAVTGTLTAKAAGVNGNGTNIVVEGNWVHSIYCGVKNGLPDPSSPLQNHGFYVDGNGSYEFAYNLLENIYGGNGFQVYVNGGNGSTIADNVSFHHNVVHGTGKHGINLADNTQSNITVYDNLVYNTQHAGLRLNSTLFKGVAIYNNTFYNTNLGGDIAEGIITNDDPINGGIAIANNIFYPNGSYAYIAGAEGYSSSYKIEMSNNLWYGGIGSAYGANAYASKPLFLAPGTDFHLESTSPGVNDGTSAAGATNTPTVSALVTSDLDDVTRPVHGAYDIGAYER